MRNQRLVPVMTRHPRAVVAALLAIVAAACNVSAGPVIAYDFSRQKRVFGWEAGAGVGPERVNVGQSFGEERVTYLVIEPWLFLGATVGVAFHGGGASPVAGLWEALPLSPGPACEQDDPWRLNRPLVTLAGGYRYLAGGHQLYFSPKLGATGCVNDGFGD